MDPFSRAIGFAVAIAVFFFIAIVGGRLVGLSVSKNSASRQAISTIAALVIFLFLFFLSRKLVGA